MENEHKPLSKYEKYCKGKPASDSLKRAKQKYYQKKKAERLLNIANGVDIAPSNYEKYVKDKPQTEAAVRARKKYYEKKKDSNKAKTI